jgi:RNA polymerase sigma-70 factor (ECF subfamily)
MQDRQMIESLFRRHYGRMLLTARTLLRDQEAARDVVSDVFAELLESSRQLDKERIESYLLVCVRNKCLNLVKHRMIEERASQHISREPIDEGYTELPLDDVLQYISQKLTPQTREVMMRRFGEGQRYNDIADGLGISRIAVYKHIAQALTKLKKQFVWKS